jgi:hypothetical protein
MREAQAAVRSAAAPLEDALSGPNRAVRIELTSVTPLPEFPPRRTVGVLATEVLGPGSPVKPVTDWPRRLGTALGADVRGIANAVEEHLGVVRMAAQVNSPDEVAAWSVGFVLVTRTHLATLVAAVDD